MAESLAHRVERIEREQNVSRDTAVWVALAERRVERRIRDKQKEMEK